MALFQAGFSRRYIILTIRIRNSKHKIALLGFIICFSLSICACGGGGGGEADGSSPSSDNQQNNEEIIINGRA